MKRLKILLVLVFSLFVTENLQDAEASGSTSESHLGQNGHSAPLTPLEEAKASLGGTLRVLVTKHKSVIHKKSRSSKAYLKIDQATSLSAREININELIRLFQQEANTLAGDNIESTIDFLNHANNALKSKPWEEYSGNTATIAGYLKFITSVSRAWFHTQPNSNVNTLCVEANRKNKIFLFVSGPVPFTDDGATRLKNIIDISKRLVQCKKTVEVIDIHTLLGIESPDFKRFMHFLYNLDINPQLGVNPQSLDAKDRSKSERFSLYLKNYLNNDMSSIEQAFKELRNKVEATASKFNNLGYFTSAQDNKDFVVFCKEFLKILSFCEISENIGIEDNQALQVSIEGIHSCRNTIIHFLRGKMTPRKCIEILFLEDDNTTMSIINLLHTEKILITGLKCLEISPDVGNALDNIIKNDKRNALLKRDDLLRRLYQELCNKGDILSEVEKFICNRLKGVDEIDTKLHKIDNKLHERNKERLQTQKVLIRRQRLLEKEDLKFSDLQKSLDKKMRKMQRGQLSMKYLKDLSKKKSDILKKIERYTKDITELRRSLTKCNQEQALLEADYSSYRRHVNVLKERCISEFKVILNIYNILISLKSTSLNVTSFVRICDTCEPYIELLIKDSTEHRVEYRQL